MPRARSRRWIGLALVALGCVGLGLGAGGCIFDMDGSLVAKKKDAVISDAGDAAPPGEAGPDAPTGEAGLSDAPAGEAGPDALVGEAGLSDASPGGD